MERKLEDVLGSFSEAVNKLVVEKVNRCGKLVGVDKSFGQHPGRVHVMLVECADGSGATPLGIIRSERDLVIFWDKLATWLDMWLDGSANTLNSYCLDKIYITTEVKCEEFDDSYSVKVIVRSWCECPF